MASVNVCKNVSLTVDDKEKDVLQEAHDILENIRHQWFISDDGAWDNEEYWTLESSVKMLEEIFGCKSEKHSK
jgi:hypothetical protein